jgi:glycosyltransferase involved in cell wall biosynthesis
MYRRGATYDPPGDMRVAMLYTWDWSQEFRDYEAGLVPAHRLFGATQLPEHGLTVATWHWGRMPNSLRRRQFWKIWQALWVFCIQRRVTCVIATTEASALPVLLLRLIGVFRTPVVVLSVGSLTDSYLHGLGGRVRRTLLRRASRVVVFASAQKPHMTQHLGIDPSRVRFIPFGVDVKFFQPLTEPVSPGWDVVSVGTNEGKDFGTLVAALAPGTRRLIVTDSQNADQIQQVRTEGDVTVDHDVPILELRALYASASQVVIPLRDVLFSTGQTVLLENLAMGRPVVVSDTASVRDYASADVATLVAPGSVEEMKRALSTVRSPYVAAASAHVRKHFTSERFADDLAALCRELARTS